jgi:trimethylamine--corrinoid protein Co-methyltransferase
MIKGFVRKGPSLEQLTAEEVAAVHQGALYVIGKTGMKIDHQRALELLAQHGCPVDFEARRVRFPAGLVEESLRKIPSSFLLRARNREKDLIVGDDRVYFMQGMGMRYVDLETWKSRPASHREHKEAIIVADYLENTHLVDGWEILCDRQGVPPVMGFLENLANGIRYSSKTQVAGNVQGNEVFAIQMAKAVGTDLLPEIENAAPLSITGRGVEAAWRYVEAGIPIVPGLSVSMGGTGPITMAGAVVQQMAELMGWMTLVQLIRPGAPVAIHHGGSPLNMRTGDYFIPSPSRSIVTTMINQMLRHYHIPSWVNSGWTSSSKKIDYQVAFDKGLGALAGSLSGGNLILFQGGSSIELTYSSVLAIMDDDMAGWIGHYLEGPTVNHVTLALDVIDQVGPLPGHFLGTAHTREWYVKEHYLPKMVDVEPYQTWQTGGKKDMLTLAKEKMAEILAHHQPEPLESAQTQAIEDILKEAREFYRKQGIISQDQWEEYMRVLKSDFD